MSTAGSPAFSQDRDMQERIERVRSQIEERKHRRHTNKVLHCHPSPLLWKERQLPLEQILRRRIQDLDTLPKCLNLYVAVPYCVRTNPPNCGYCLFPHEVYTGPEALNSYLEYLRQEGCRFRDFFAEDRLGSIYFGGGTPNICKADTYPRLMEIVREVFDNIPDDLEITLEGVPQLFTWQKLSSMKEAGINRISIGVQQLSDELIKLSGRKQTASQVFEVLEWCNTLGLRTSVDLIYGWPRQTVELMLKDLEAIVGAGISHITHYELNLGGRTDFARNRRHELPSIEQNLEMFRVAKNFLESSGFHQVTSYDWEKSSADKTGRLQFEDHMRHFFQYSEEEGVTGMDMWGWGFAGVSYFIGTPETPGCVYMNSLSVSDYCSALDQGVYPIERGYMYEIEDVRLGWLFQSLQNTRIDVNAYRAIFGLDVLIEHAPLWHVLQELCWADVSSECVQLVGDGIFFTPLIQTVLASERNDALRRLQKH